MVGGKACSRGHGRRAHGSGRASPQAEVGAVSQILWKAEHGLSWKVLQIQPDGEVQGDYIQLQKEGQKGMRWSRSVCNRSTNPWQLGCDSTAL